MKSLAELQAIRDKMRQQIDLRDSGDDRIGVCRLEPIVEVYVPGQEKVTYVKMTPDKVASIVSEHLVNGRVVTEYTIGAAE